jgi:hypothetical protein
MNDAEAAAQQDDLISALFALLMVKFEEAASIAARCQDHRSGLDLLGGALSLITLTEEAVIVAKATLELVHHIRPKPDRPAQ